MMGVDREYVTEQFRANNKAIAQARAAVRKMYDANGPKMTPDRKALLNLIEELTMVRSTCLRKLLADGAIICHLQQEQSEVDEDPRTAYPGDK